MERTAVRETVHTAQLQRFNFNGYVALRRRQHRPIDDTDDIVPINGDRADFHACLYDPEGKPKGWEPAPEWMTAPEWDMRWTAFCQQQDSRDQHETQRDALAA
ncbi:MAG: hypothetical protein EHM35_15825 [Planctomycetaceae bacterium]|nr:MAG: hypothetical protein EHM35_15825 [Planctomycetaceae bacterium]